MLISSGQYYSMMGNSRYVAQKVAEALGADMIPLTPVKAYPDSGFRMFFWGGKSAVMGEKPKLELYAFDASAYDLVILGGPVWAGTFAPPLRTFMAENRNGLQGKRVAAFFCCSGGPGKVVEKFAAFCPAGKPEPAVILVDPKDKPSGENAEKIRAFCHALQ